MSAKVIKLQKKAAAEEDVGTDVANAARFAAKFSGRLIYIPQRGQWCEYDEQVWEQDELKRITQHAIHVAADMRIESAQLMLSAATAGQQAEKDRLHAASETLARAAKALSSKARLEAMIAIAATDPRLARHQSALDVNDMLLAIKNGVIDLETGTFRPGDPADLLTRQAGTEFRGGWESEPCAAWEKFLVEVQPDPDVRAWLQRFAGYCLTGRVDEQILAVMHGVGSNGKTVFMETIKKMMGTYAATSQFDTFTEKKSGGDQIRNDLARLDKVRLVVAAEGPEGARLDEGIVKQLTGGDEITARFLHREFFTYRPRFKIVLVTNHRPVITGTDHGIWRRVVLVPWTVTIPTGRRDRRLAERLEGELPGILAWALKGLTDYLTCGLELPQALVKANSDYRRDSDTIGLWLDDCCQLAAGLTAPAAALYESYTTWTARNGHRPISSKTLGDRLRERGLTPTRDRSGKRAWAGIDTKPVI